MQETIVGCSGCRAIHREPDWLVEPLLVNSLGIVAQEGHDVQSMIRHTKYLGTSLRYLQIGLPISIFPQCRLDALQGFKPTQSEANNRDA